jgi:membrane protease YdiL (CAAX protease family)
MVSGPDTIDATPEFVETPVPQAPRNLRVQSILEVLLCSGFPTQLLIAGALALLFRPSIPTDGTLPFDFIVVVSLLDTVVLIGLVVLFLRVRGERPSQVLLGQGPLLGEVARGVLWLPVVFAVVIVLGTTVQQLAPWLHNVPKNPLQAMLTSPWRVALFALVAVCAGGLREEVQRAFILHRFDQDLGGARLGLILFSVAFGLGHLTQGFDAALITGTLGLLWGLIYLSRRSMVAPAVSHALFNLLEIALYQYASKNGLLPT